ncbi:unnamed protein product [Amoebophrya sp. A120]|nr:unnamed protein product [Amoebophrya sp. A120]CAD7945432.1 unnamed protein product [Amoebophrya sp. A120]|eukprot:GSA120T00000624001.1
MAGASASQAGAREDGGKKKISNNGAAFDGYRCRAAYRKTISLAQSNPTRRRAALVASPSPPLRPWRFWADLARWPAAAQAGPPSVPRGAWRCSFMYPIARRPTPFGAVAAPICPWPAGQALAVCVTERPP